MLMRREGGVRSSRATAFQSSVVQALATLALAIALPVFLRYPGFVVGASDKGPLQISIVGALIGALGGLALFRRLTAFPGVSAFGYIMPAYAISYGTIALGMFYFRLDYSRYYLGASFALALATAYFLALISERYSRLRIWVVPHGDVDALIAVEGVDWITMSEPVLPATRSTPIVADLRHDHDPAWERILAEAAINGHGVYHVKQLWESLTGRVSMEHLSENSFGSLIPNLAYRNFKRALDIATCLVMLPVLIVPMSVIAILVKMDSPGSIFFAHGRMGYRNRPFRMLKFRTMRDRPPDSDNDARLVAMTLPDDDRITRIGRFLRRTRLDELPQIINVLRGEMSLIGPRPEALALAQWYEEEIPFYAYRHIVRPGITGWAQVRQGHVVDLDAAHQKLSYDFFYIKNFSAWLDILIALRTPRIMVSGFGSK